MAFDLPTSTEMRKQLPKKSIYAKFELKPSQRESFDADISRIDIVAIVSSVTVPALSEGKDVKEFYILTVQLKRKEYDVQNISLLAKLIPQRMVLALQFEEQTQFAIYYTKLIASSWQSSEEARLPLSGLNLDSVWENIVTNIGQIKISEGNTLAEQIKVEEMRTKVKAQIASLTQRLNKEKQFNRQMEINAEIKSLRKQLINLI